ncbi:MAG TPA: hypothetical protein VMY88_10745 [Acidimicrobiales bacterium]|nr:hypothetical protein [Acidimicrobiales bacterium]
MVKSPRWVRRAVLSCALLGLVAIMLPSPTLAPPERIGLADGSRPSAPAASANPGASAAATDVPSAVPTNADLEGYAAARPVDRSDAGPAAPVVSAPGNATPVRLTRDDPACGVGLTRVEMEGGDIPASCVHTFQDPVPGRGASQGAVRTQPTCYGDGVSGPRIQFVYVYAEGQPNKAAEYIPHMLNSWIPAMEGAFRSTSRAQGREIGMRVHMPNCEIEIGVVRISADDAEPDEPGAMRSRIEQAMYDAGYNKSNRKYHAWFDGANKGACGVAPVIPFPVVGDNATPANPNNVGSTPVVNLFAQVAVTFKYPFPLPPGMADPGPMCWGNGGMGALTETHELLHLLGSVMPSAPNSNGLGHCRDEVDIMCYSEGGVETFTRCSTEVEALDCGSDDYFNARPQLGSYLSYNWNTANSKFLGAAPEDNSPVEIPRP